MLGRNFWVKAVLGILDTGLALYWGWTIAYFGPRATPMQWVFVFLFGSLAIFYGRECHSLWRVRR